MLRNMKKSFSPVMEDGEAVVVLRFQPYAFTGRDLVRKKIRSLLKRKPNAQYEMDQQVYSFLKQWFLTEPRMGSHLFQGKNIFCVYDASDKTYLVLNSADSIKEASLPLKARTSPASKTVFWMLESVERKRCADVAGTYHEVSCICGLYFKKTA